MKTFDVTKLSLEEKGKYFQKIRNYTLDADKIIIAHLDGRSFSKSIKKQFKKPFDDDFIAMMNETAIYLCKKVQGVQFAYTQSDEITLILKKNNPEGNIFFGGRMCKMQSILASMATAKFNQLMFAYNISQQESYYISADNLYEEIDSMQLYEFDCKVWDVDTGNDAFAWVLFRNIDCTRNSKQQFAQAYMTYSELLRLTADEQVALVKEVKQKDWNDVDDGKKFGRFIKKSTTEFFNEELNTTYERTFWEAYPGMNLTNPEEREKLLNEFEFLKN